MDSNPKINAFLVPRELTYFRNLYEEYYAQLVRFAEAIVFDKEEAEDIVQEVFFNLWDKSGKLHLTTGITGYLFTSVKNKALNHLKTCRVIDKHNERIREAFLFACHLEPEHDEELLKKAFILIDDFPVQMKKVILMKAVDGMKYEEIAKHMNISINTVKSHLKKAFRLLRQKMGKAIMILPGF